MQTVICYQQYHHEYSSYVCMFLKCFPNNCDKAYVCIFRFECQIIQLTHLS